MTLLCKEKGRNSLDSYPAVITFRKEWKVDEYYEVNNTYEKGRE